MVLVLDLFSWTRVCGSECALVVVVVIVVVVEVVIVVDYRGRPLIDWR